MVLQRRLNYGFNGYQVPVVPRASRSARGRGSFWKKVGYDPIRAFEILATVAGSFLQENENSAPLNTAEGTSQHTVHKNTDKQELKDGEKSMELKACVQRICDDKALAFLAEYEGNHQNESAMSFAKKGAIMNSKNACKSSSTKVVEVSPVYGKSLDYKVEGVNGRNRQVEAHKVRSSISRTVCDKSSPTDPMELEWKPPALVSPNSCKASMFKAGKNVNPFSRCQNNLVASRDDDENSYGCSQRGTEIKAYRPPLHMGDRKLRKQLAYKPCRAGSNLKEGGYLNTDGTMKPIYRNWKTCYARQRSQRMYPFKRRKLLGRSPLSKSGRDFSWKDLFNPFEKGMTGDNGSAERKASSSVAGQEATLKTGECNVKLSIKSFRVPELFIDLPATATVGSLKRAVMDAVTAVLGDGLHVGMLLQGKKIKDDSKTLRQTGIYRDKKLHSLGFMLEPKHEQILSPLCTEDPSFLPPGGISPWLTRHSATSMLVPGASNVSSSFPGPNLSDHEDNELDTLPIFSGISTEEIMAESKALVAVPEMSMVALAAVPCHNQFKHPEFAQRRIRRPFSVSEVEALVQAVEKLGTGRWRDVKLRAFYSVKHRTYVDLKKFISSLSDGNIHIALTRACGLFDYICSQDKWKTLVHTAKISPQQRRGEPVPQDLLDRVLAAHAFWSYEHAKLQVDAAA